MPRGEWDGNHRSTTVTIGIYDTLEEAIIAGNEKLKVLAEHFEVREDDKFQLNFLFGQPKRLVTNCCYPTKGIEFFAKITQLKFDCLMSMVDETFTASERYRQYKIKNQS